MRGAIELIRRHTRKVGTHIHETRSLPHPDRRPWFGRTRNKFAAPKVSSETELAHMLSLKKTLLTVVLAVMLAQVQGMPFPESAECAASEGVEDVAIDEFFRELWAGARERELTLVGWS